GQAEETHTLTLAVLREIVPNEQTITADLNNYADSVSPHFAHLAGRADRYTDGSFFRLESQFHRLAHEHRALFHHLPYRHSGQLTESFYPELEGGGKRLRVKDWSLFDEHF